jgi:hypothetical protein
LVDFPAIRYKVIAIWYSFWSFGIFPPFWWVVPRKIWQPWVSQSRGATLSTLSLPTCIISLSKGWLHCM